MTDLGKTLRKEDIEGLVEISYGLWGKPCNTWTAQHFKHQTYGKGDIIYTTCRVLLENDFIKEDAEVSLIEIYLLLQIPVRWDYNLNDDNDAKTKREYKRSHKAYKRFAEERMELDGTYPWPRKYRTQTGMTRDPYVYFFAACVKYGFIDYIKWTKIPWISEGHLLFRLNLWLWKKALVTGKRNRLYELIERKPNHKEDYVNLLRHYRMKAYKKRTS